MMCIKPQPPKDPTFHNWRSLDCLDNNGNVCSLPFDDCNGCDKLKMELVKNDNGTMGLTFECLDCTRKC